MRRSRSVSRRRVGFSRPGKRSRSVASRTRSTVSRAPATNRAYRGRSEVKYVDTAISSTLNTPSFSGTGGVGAPTTIGSGGLFYLLNWTNEGSAPYQRVGRKMKMKSIHVTCNLNWVANETWDYIRCMLIYDRQPTGSAPVLADILQDYPTSQSTTGAFLAQAPGAFSRLNMNNVERFVILRDHRFPVWGNNDDAMSGRGGDKHAPYFEWFVPLKGLECHFGASNTNLTIGDIKTGALWLMALSQQGAAAIIGSSRLRFKDTY